MRIEKLRDRIRKRLDAMNLSVAETERMAGFAKNYLDDFLSDRKKSMKPDAIENLAEVLKTTVDWLLVGKEPEVVDKDERHVSSSIVDGTEWGDSKITHVGKTEAKDILIVSINLETGDCLFKDIADGAAPQTYSGVICDPALKMVRNPYTRGFMSHLPVKALVKKVTLDNGAEKFVIIDDREGRDK